MHPPPPFEQLPFASIPELPLRPHRFFEVPAREIVVRSAPFGRLRVHLRELGEGPPLLLVHGLMTTSYSWRYVIHPFASDFRVIVPDLPGSGRSDKPNAPSYGPEALSTFLGELVEALGIQGCAVMGNSLGGYLSTWLALERPSCLGRLVNMHSPAQPELRMNALHAVLSIPGIREVLRRWVHHDVERWAHRNVHYYDESLKSREEAREYGAPLQSDEGFAAFFRYLRESLAPSGFRALERRLGELRANGEPFPVPLMLLYGRNDPLVSPSNAYYLKRLIPDARLEWLDAASHFAQVDVPDAVVRITRPFLLGR